MEYTHRESLIKKTFTYTIEDESLNIKDNKGTELKRIPFHNLTRLNFQVIPSSKNLPKHYKLKIYEGDNCYTFGNLHFKRFASFKNNKEEFNQMVRLIVNNINLSSTHLTKGSSKKVIIMINLLMILAICSFALLGIMLYKEDNTITAVIMGIGIIYSLFSWRNLLNAHKFVDCRSREEFLEFLP